MTNTTLIITITISFMIIMAIYALVQRMSGKPSDADAACYDENGNHRYYDRKMIRQRGKKMNVES